jgi:hypothetical protein
MCMAQYFENELYIKITMKMKKVLTLAINPVNFITRGQHFKAFKYM